MIKSKHTLLYYWEFFKSSNKKFVYSKVRNYEIWNLVYDLFLNNLMHAETP